MARPRLIVHEVNGFYVALVLREGFLLGNTIPVENPEVAARLLRESFRRAWGSVPLLDKGVDGLDVAEEIYRGFLGEPIRIDLRKVRLPPQDKLRRVVRSLLLIPRGKVTTYRAVSEVSNVHPRTAGLMLSRNPLPIVYPCHRVVKSDLSLGGYSYGLDKKVLLLRREGVEVINSKKVSPRNILWSLKEGGC